ncbi:hypothetical protein Patl1_18676 [Pistacia atlantica]|uniref:Uncharacterized protein n=1 Tax=Pistacia atlantica TaxID=434234 RepID=A0ACC1C004_9ROSI|nr:hypothetical protein Patl1_18676 [Pistacia atlantica]
MAFGALSDSKYQLALCFKAMTQQQSSNSESDNSLQKDGHYQAAVTSLLNVSSGNFPASVGKVAHMNECMVSKKTNPTLVNETANFQPSMLSSLVPEGSSAVSTHANSDVYSYLNIPPLPLPMLPSCLSSSGTSNFGLENSQTHKRRRHRGGAKLDRATTTAVHKKARLEMEQEAIQQHQNVLQYYPKLDSGVCSRRIMQYMYHLRHRPSDNGIAFWRKLVSEYFAPCAKKRWCLSSYDDVERYALGVFPQVFMNTWQCDVCGCKSGRGFEANLEALPRLNKIMFESGVIDELLYLDLPCELIQFSGLMTLEYGKAVQESVYEQFRVVREGKLRISFASDLKILSWEFCAWHHEELLPRNLVAPQINKLVHTVQSYQSSIDCGGWDGVSPHDLQANCNVFLVGGCQLVRNLELQPVDNLGFSKRYVRCLQISEIINSMKDLITFSMDKNIGPIESLKCYSQENRTTKPQEDEPQRKESDHYPSVGRRKLMATSLFNNDGNEKSDITRRGPMTASEEALVVRDPRFESLCGNLDVDGFRKRYDFLFENNLPAEKEELKKQLKKTNDPDVIEELKKHISWIDKQLKFETAKSTDAAVLSEHKKKEREAAKHGKRPFYLKKSEIRKQRLVEKYNKLKASGKLESFIEKKRRKNASKDHKYMPYRRPNTNTEQ